MYIYFKSPIRLCYCWWRQHWLFWPLELQRIRRKSLIPLVGLFSVHFTNLSYFNFCSFVYVMQIIPGLNDHGLVLLASTQCHTPAAWRFSIALRRWKIYPKLKRHWQNTLPARTSIRLFPKLLNNSSFNALRQSIQRISYKNLTKCFLVGYYSSINILVASPFIIFLIIVFIWKYYHKYKRLNYLRSFECVTATSSNRNNSAYREELQILTI